jgi:hypothetical protein
LVQGEVEPGRMARVVEGVGRSDFAVFPTAEQFRSSRLSEVFSARFNDGRFRVTTEAQLRARARFVFTGHWPLEAWGVGTLPR